MQKLTRQDLYSLESYAEERAAFRARVLAHKRQRQLPLGEFATLYFEDRLTMQYQIQEMLRIERIFEPAAIEEELAAYNPLIPDGSNWKATLMFEYPDVEQRQQALARLGGVEQRVWVEVAGQERVYAVANEDLERSSGEKAAAVHFLRFELTPAMVTALKGGAGLNAGVDHDAYSVETTVPDPVLASLVADLD